MPKYYDNYDNYNSYRAYGGYNYDSKSYGDHNYDSKSYGGHNNAGLDKLVHIIKKDPGLADNVSKGDIYVGAKNAGKMNDIIEKVIKDTGVANDGKITSKDVYKISHRIEHKYEYQWAKLHGDDEDGSETGFHRVQNDGATTKLFHQNAVDTVADGIYHLGFGIKNGHLINEDGNANASLKSVARWLDKLLEDDLENGSLANKHGGYSDHQKSYDDDDGSGLDKLVHIIKKDPGLADNVSKKDIYVGAKNAGKMNDIIEEVIKDTGVAKDGKITSKDVYKISHRIEHKYEYKWAKLHGDDENGSETGFHRVQNDGATTKLFHQNAVDTIADGIYHLGFGIEKGRLINEDGNPNASVKDVARWMDKLLDADLHDGSLVDGNQHDYEHDYFMS